jgi:hypothetical protein
VVGSCIGPPHGRCGDIILISLIFISARQGETSGVPGHMQPAAHIMLGSSGGKSLCTLDHPFREGR